MRRNPAYQQDYAWRIKTWNTLEQAYGLPPYRDYPRWKQNLLHSAVHYRTVTTATSITPVLQKVNACK